MDKTAFQASVPTPADGIGAPPMVIPVKERRVVVEEPLWKVILRPLASLRLTVVLFALAGFLVFAGTLAQVEGGTWTIVSKYFRCPIAWVDFQVFVKFGQVFLGLPKTWEVRGSFPYPGGWVVGGLLLANLLAAHAVRFKLGWKRAGIMVLHSGLIILLLSELVTGLFALEANIVLREGETVNFADITQPRKMEVAVIERNGSQTYETVVPDALLAKEGLIQNDDLPFDIRVDRYMVNAAVVRARPGDDDNPATAGDGLTWKAILKGEVSGTDANQTIDLTSAYVTFFKKGTDESLGTYLVSLFFYSNATRRVLPDRPQQVTVDGKTYDVFLRFRRAYKPYSLYLIDFRHDTYLGTGMPKNFSSQLRVIDPERKDDREVLVRMNEPLFYQGETFYQSGWLENDAGTILQVVHNPGWMLPYISCAMVALGMLIHFSTHLIGFLTQRVVK